MTDDYLRRKLSCTDQFLSNWVYFIIIWEAFKTILIPEPYHPHTLIFWDGSWTSICLKVGQIIITYSKGFKPLIELDNRENYIKNAKKKKWKKKKGFHILGMHWDCYFPLVLRKVKVQDIEPHLTSSRKNGILLAGKG